MSLIDRIEQRQREMIFLAVIAYNVEMNPKPWIRRHLERLVRLKRRIEQNSIDPSSKQA